MGRGRGLRKERRVSKAGYKLAVPSARGTSCCLVSRNTKSHFTHQLSLNTITMKSTSLITLTLCAVAAASPLAARAPECLLKCRAGNVCIVDPTPRCAVPDG